MKVAKAAKKALAVSGIKPKKVKKKKGP